MVGRDIEWRVVSLIAISWHSYTYGTDYDSESCEVLDTETFVVFQGDLFCVAG
jgi:hypothetical protein